MEGDEDGDWDGEYEEEEEDIEAEAEQIASGLWAELSKEVAAPAPTPAPPAVPTAKEKATVATVRAILASLERDPAAHSTFAASKIPESAGESLLDVLNQIAASGTVPRGLALALSRFLISLAKSEVLFGTLRHSDASTQQLKRKRDEEVGSSEPARKRAHTSGDAPLFVEVAEAVRVITTTLTTSPALTPNIITSIQPHLHRAFLFAITSSATGESNKNPLQEIGGLIQVLGVLSGIQIGQTPAAESQKMLSAVHPCLVARCGKFFARLTNLRAHEEKRHKPQPQTLWKCGGCQKVSNVRDTIERHKTTIKSRRPDDPCANAPTVEMESGDRAATAVVSGEADEGEIEASLISRVQSVVLELHPLLQTLVSRALGAPSAPAPSAPADNGQGTLASAIARSQVPAPESSNAPSLSSYGLSNEQTKQLEVAVANATTTAKAYAEAQAELEDEDADGESDGGFKPPPPV
ncbi:hypothetical protein FB45DRAFT_735777 [Roridomyces roridus]|uniref:C2H2-type domain-containing protein n=1 Tax=Roridomyces roridus TaxID=1738132 RepID=A0AAD7CBK3_9AGAR|nr:hypothetical protein FB45DRAFT_735777 [Roridomyces roridus]